jgi:hypothetical protein
VDSDLPVLCSCQCLAWPTTLSTQQRARGVINCNKASRVAKRSNGSWSCLFFRPPPPRMHRLQDVVPTTWARCSACRHRGPPAPCMPPITESSSFVIAGVVFARARARWNRPVQLLPRESSERKRKQLPLTWTARVPVPFFESVNDNIWPWRLSNPDCNNTLSAAERWALDYCAG